MLETCPRRLAYQPAQQLSAPLTSNLRKYDNDWTIIIFTDGVPAPNDLFWFRTTSFLINYRFPKVWTWFTIGIDISWHALSGRNTSSGFHHQWNCQTGARTAQICLSGAVWAHRDLATTRGLHCSSYHVFSLNPINNQTKPIWATIWGSSFFLLNKSLRKAIQRAYNVFILNKSRGDSELTGWAEFISGSAGGGDDWRTLMKN